MDLDNLAIQPRLRNGWAAIDLGFVIARRWWRQLFLAWVLPSLCLFVILSLCFPERAWIPLLVVWWLKPIWDRVPLFVASRRLFGESVGFLDGLKAFWKIATTDIVAWLTYRRLSFTRSFDLPVTVLEKLQGEKRAKRLSLLHQRAGNTASWMTVACIHMEAVIMIGLVGFVYLLIPSEYDQSFSSLWQGEGLLIEHLSNFVSYAAMAIVGPFYSMAGFSLYINRRIELEGWDIELRFRHLAQQSPESARRPSTAVAGFAAALVVFLMVASPHPAMAVEGAGAAGAATSSMSSEQAQATVAEVLAGESFHEIVEKSGWRLKKQPDESDDEIPGWWIKLLEFLEGLFDGGGGGDGRALAAAAELLEVMLWVAVAALFIYLVYRYRHILQSALAMARRTDSEEPPVEILFGLDLRKETLPDDVLSEARSLWADNRHREAMSLLYRATLSRLVHDFSFRFREGHTEQECAAIVAESANSKLTGFVLSLTAAWQQFAYGHRTPEETVFAGFCEQWGALFQREK